MTKLHYLHLTFKFSMMCSIRLISFFLCLLSMTLVGQTSSFPDDWFGQWKGELEIYAGLNKVNSLPMMLEINAVDSLTYTYFITYGTGADALRPYYLNVIDADKGLYVLDENNGILIETSLIGGRLVSLFEVQNSLIQSTTYLVDDMMHYEIYAGSYTPASMTGDTIVGRDTIPVVRTFPINVSQRAVLSKN